jgi:hypothetical protein
MTRVVVDPTLRSKLHNRSEPLELCDESGRVLARVIPQGDLDPAQYDLEPQLSREEMRRRKQSNEPTYTTAEVLACLEKM